METRRCGGDSGGGHRRSAFFRPFFAALGKERAVLFLQKRKNPPPTIDNEILLFGNAVGVVSLNPDELLGIIVESQTFTKTMKAVFDLAWLGATAFVAK